MKTVFSNDMVAHVWAAQSQQSGRNSAGNFSFASRELRSYRTIIGVHFGAFVVLSRERYSMTTGVQLSLAWRAVRHLDSYVADDLDSLARVPCTVDKVQRGERTLNWLTRNALHVSDDLAAALLTEAGLRPNRWNPIKRKALADKAKADAKEQRAALDKAKRTLATCKADNATLIAGVLASDSWHWGTPAQRLEKAQKRIRQAQRLITKAKANPVHWQASQRAIAYLGTADAVESFIAMQSAEQRQTERRRANNDIRTAISHLRDPLGAGGLQNTYDSAYPSESRLVPPTDWQRAMAFARLVENMGYKLRNLADQLRGRFPVAMAATIESLDSAQEALVGWTQSESVQAEIARHKVAHDLHESELRAIAQAERERIAADALPRWQAGLPAEYGAPRLSDERGGAMLRAVKVTRDESGAITGGTLQTSHGADVPLLHAIKAFQFLKLCREKGKGWQRNGRTIRVGHFQVDSVMPSGDFIAGCHRINWPQVAYVAESLGLMDIATSESALEATSDKESV